MKKIDWDSHLVIGVIGCLVGWIATWIVEYIIVAAIGFDTSVCVWFVIKLNVFVIALVVAVGAIIIGGCAFAEWTKEHD